ncbi:hypothetical protein [Streptomyces microflavus]|uniref:hypothetical protein n=1 Tax=Streptomyces microflavus TaxID=1919 RepID=UPI0036B4D8B1
MATLSEIRKALAETIRASVSTEIHDYAEVPDVLRLPAIVVRPVSGDFTGAFQRGLDTWQFDVFVLVARMNGETQQELLDEFLTGSGPNSIREAVYENPTLGREDVIDAMVKKMHGYGGTFQAAHVNHTGAILNVTVHTDGTN